MQALRSVARGPLVRGVAVVSGGTAVAQLVTVLVSPITSRQYGPDAYGVANVFLSLAGILSPLAGLTYGYAVVIPKEDTDALTLARIAAWSSVAVAAAVVVVVGVLNGQIAALASFSGPEWLLLALAPAVLFAGLSTVLSQWLIRKRRFRTLGGLSAGQSLAVNGARVLLGLAVPTAWVLVAVSVLGSAFYSVVAWFGARPSLRDARPSRSSVPPRPWRETARRYRDFPLYREPQMLLNAVSANLPVILLGAFFGPAIPGLYGLARNVVSLPGRLISDSVSKVVLPHAAEAAQRGESLRPLVARTTMLLMAIGVVPFGTVVLLGPWLFGVVFGQDWSTAGEYARWLSLWAFFAFANPPSVQVVPLLGLQAWFLVYEVGLTAARVVAIVVGAEVLGGSLAAVALFSVVGVVANLVLIASVTVASARLRRPGI